MAKAQLVMDEINVTHMLELFHTNIMSESSLLTRSNTISVKSEVDLHVMQPTIIKPG